MGGRGGEEREEMEEERGRSYEEEEKKTRRRGGDGFCDKTSLFLFPDSSPRFSFFLIFSSFIFFFLASFCLENFWLFSAPRLFFFLISYPFTYLLYHLLSFSFLIRIFPATGCQNTFCNEK